MLLAQGESVFYAGELQALWGPTPLADELCSCGAPMLSCELWRAVFEEAFGCVPDARMIARLRFLRDATSRARHVFLEEAFRRRPQWGAMQREFLEHTVHLYLAIQRVTRCRVIVDTSKWPSYVLLLARQPALEVRVTHLVRDPRAVAYSWQRAKAWRTTGAQQVRRQSPWRSAMSWLRENALLGMMRPFFHQHYMRMRYEDFARAPVTMLNSLLRFVGVPELKAPASTREFHVRGHHVFGANPDRLGRDEIIVQPDEAWRTELSLAHCWSVRMITLPLALRYGYL
ncbi:sulfotransferase domain-containing protein [Candidatus Roseilinea sp. NK_OTU-006]|uniref:sulfotransferase domain-containing protein n=1 Tax=Candidatus Roseilinea sp. NK_OTU-006 TaxID=2704250 RepID=UPI00145DB3D2